jgi:hypothetical protein
MPLVWVTIAFALLFCSEGIYNDFKKSAASDALDRYQYYEHPRHRTDSYIDQ